MSKSREDMFREIYDNIGRAMITENENDALYEEVLDAILKLVTDPNPINKEETKQLLEKNRSTIESAPVHDNHLTDEYTEFMMQNDIDIGDYTAGFNQQARDIEYYITNISSFIDAIENMSNERLDEFLSILRKNQNARKRITSIGFNHLYAHISDDDLTYFMINIFPKVGSFFDGVKWCNSKVDLEQEVQIYFTEIMAARDEMEIFNNTLELDKLAAEKIKG